MINKEFFKNLDLTPSSNVAEDVLQKVIDNSTWKIEPAFIEEHQIGSQEFIICYDYDDCNEEITIVDIYLKAFDLNDNEIWVSVTDVYDEFFKTSEIEEYLYELHSR